MYCGFFPLLLMIWQCNIISVIFLLMIYLAYAYYYIPLQYTIFIFLFFFVNFKTIKIISMFFFSFAVDFQRRNESQSSFEKVIIKKNLTQFSVVNLLFWTESESSVVDFFFFLWNILVMANFFRNQTLKLWNRMKLFMKLYMQLNWIKLNRKQFSCFFFLTKANPFPL